jgi:hypothetical protein
MKRRNFGLALTATVLAAVALAQSGLRQIVYRFFYSVTAWLQTRAKLNETQKRIDGAREDLGAIVRAELGYIQKRGKFSTLDELVSSHELGPEMAGRHGYVYSIRLEGNSITASAYPAPGEQLPALVNDSFGLVTGTWTGTRRDDSITRAWRIQDRRRESAHAFRLSTRP